MTARRHRHATALERLWAWLCDSPDVGWRRRWLRKQGLMPAARVSRPWTAEEDAVILTLPTCEAARKLGRNQSSVSTRKSALAKGVAA